MQKLSFVFIFLLCIIAASAQDAPKKEGNSEREERRSKRREKINALIKQEEEGALVFHKQTIYGFKINTDGYSFFFEKAKMQSSRVANFYSIEWGEKKNPQEKKISVNAINGAGFVISTNPFIFAKRNIFYQVKIGYGQQRVIGYRGNKNGVSVTGVYAGGFSAGLLRPYYLRVDDNNQVRDIKYSARQPDSALFLGSSIIEGTGLKHGWNELKFTPGLHARAGLRFDYGRFNELVSAIEVGVNADYYFTKPEIMLIAKNRQFFFSSYVSINFGRRK